MRINDISDNFWDLLESSTPEKNSISTVNNNNNRPDKTDTRKPVLTLRTVNKLRKIRAINNQEREQKMELISVMYGQTVDDNTM